MAMVFTTPFFAFQSELYKLLTNADEMDFPVYDSSLSLQDITKQLNFQGEVNYGIITDVTGTPTSAKTDAIIWKMSVRIELFSNYRGRKRIADMITKIGEVTTQYIEPFNINLAKNNYSVVRMVIGQSTIGPAINDGAINWQNGFINIEYYLSQLED